MAMPNRTLRFGYIEFGTNRHHIHTGTFCVTSTAAYWRRRETLKFFFFFFQALNFLVESFGLLHDLFPFPSILDAGYPVLDLQLADVMFDVIVPSVLGSSLRSFS
jgi:hypothetical protein